MAGSGKSARRVGSRSTSTTAARSKAAIAKTSAAAKAAKAARGTTSSQPTKERPASTQDNATSKTIAAVLPTVALDLKKLDRLQGILENYLPDKRLPAVVDGTVVAEDDESPLEGVTVSIRVQNLRQRTEEWNAASASCVTDRDGTFSLRPDWPGGTTGEVFRLLARKGKQSASIPITYAALIERKGHLSHIRLSKEFKASLGLGERLGDLLGQINSTVPDTSKPGSTGDAGRPQVQLGEGDGSYALSWTSGAIDSFSYSILYRLIEPDIDGSNGGILIPDNAKTRTRPQRQVLNGPLDALDFRTRVETNPMGLVRMATLGLGYMVRMHQQWQPSHLSLGELLYSLPLAPGEEQRIAVFDRRESLSIADQESMSAAEYQAYQQNQDTSASAIYHAALSEHAHGHSTAESEGINAGFGTSTGAVGQYYALMFGTISAGIGGSWNKGEVDVDQSYSRGFDSRAAEDFHESLARQASGRRQTSRVGIRLASASETEQVTTKIIANHNHSHALTMQYWEVVRNYDVVTEVDDVQVVCYVPMELVQFLPSNAKHILSPQELGQMDPADILARYDMLIRCHDVILPWLWGKLSDGLRTLKQFASYPNWEVQKLSSKQYGLNERVALKGVFLPCDQLTATLILKNGRRFGPTMMTFTPSPIRTDCCTRQEVLLAVQEARALAQNVTTAACGFVLPTEVVDDDLLAVEIRHTLVPMSYKLTVSPNLPAALANIADWANQLPALLEALNNPVITLSASDLRQKVGGPPITSVIVQRQEQSADSQMQQSLSEVLEGSRRFPITDTVPTLSYQQLQRIEATFQHVVENTVLYSRAVWASLTPEERAMMLEGYTIGMPAAAGADVGSDVPLLNCVANQVVGFFGNAMIMPFGIPPRMADELGYTTRQVQEALLRFHREGFRQPRSMISLPTHGMLGEAVLGGSNSSEKIDLTRFWNWQDSPIDHADAIKPADLNQPSMLAGAAVAPDKLMTNAPANLITLNNGAPTTMPDLISKLTTVPAGSGVDVTGLSTLKDIMGKTADTASAARQQTVDASEKLAEKAMDTFVQLQNGGGQSGSSGKQTGGTQGQTGTTAQTGDKTQTGTQTTGTTGDKGQTSGTTGSKGQTGTQGSTGSTGTTGQTSTGQTGTQGSTGNTGAQGTSPTTQSGTADATGPSTSDTTWGTSPTTGLAGMALNALGSLVTTATPQVIRGQVYPTGIDVFFRNGAVDWDKVADSGRLFAFVKSTEGLTIADSKFPDYWLALGGSRLLRGAFHFFRGMLDAKKQAEFFITNTGALDRPGDLPPVLDIEWQKGDGLWQAPDGSIPPRDPAWPSADEYVQRIKAWVETVEQHYGRKPIIYTAKEYWVAATNNSTALSNYPLWLTTIWQKPPYQVAEPDLCGGWDHWTFWQYGYEPSVPGAQGAFPDGVPADLYNGTRDRLMRLALISTPGTY